MDGSPTCDPLLQPKDVAAVHQAAAQRNYDKCMNGSATCDPQRLTAEQKKRWKPPDCGETWTNVPKDRIPAIRSC